MIHLPNMLKALAVTVFAVATTAQPYYVAHFSQTYENNTWIVENAVYCVYEDGSRTLVSYKRSVENQLEETGTESVCEQTSAVESADVQEMSAATEVAQTRYVPTPEELQEAKQNLNVVQKPADWPQENQQQIIPTQEELTQTASTLWHNKLDPADETAMAEFDEEWLK